MALQVIGAGLGRTGTLTLKHALEQLGFGPCYHMVELFPNPGHIPLWRQAVEGKPDWDAIFAGYRSTTDYPGCVFWRELVARYPDAKIVLTVRDPDAWFESTQATVFAPGRDAPPGSPFATAFDIIHMIHRDLNDRASMIADFKRHNEAVIAGVPAARLLVFEAAQGWEPLCRFLGVPAPATPFPRANSREEMNAMFARTTKADGTVDVAARLAALRARTAKP